MKIQQQKGEQGLMTMNRKKDTNGNEIMNEKNKNTIVKRADSNRLKYTFEEAEPSLVSEALAEYAVLKTQGEYTVDDYLALPEGEMVELIDGVFYDMAAPHYIHQGFGDRIQTIFSNYIDAHQGSCFAFTSPIDVQLDCDNRTMVQPDVVILCDPKKFRSGRIFGAPDLIVEVLSPSTSYRDRGLKLSKYKKAGVREYWLVDPKRRRVMVYEFEKSDSARIYGFDETVSVGIYDGACKVDFAWIYERLRFLYETEEEHH